MSFRDVPKKAKMIVPEWFQELTEESEIRWDKGEVNYPLHLVNGTYQGLHQEEKATNDLIRTFETRDSDVFVCTFLKSGTTWTQQIINLLLNQGEPGGKHHSEIVPWLEALTFAGVGKRPQEQEHGSARFLTLDELKSTPNRRFMKTHANLHDLPAGTANGVKVIYVARNPKDVCVSLLHHARNSRKNAFVGEFSDMFNCFVKGRCTNGSWFDHVLEWWQAANADPEHVLFLRYEEMLADPEEHVRKIADFAGIDSTAEIVSKEGATPTSRLGNHNCLGPGDMSVTSLEGHGSASILWYTLKELTPAQLAVGQPLIFGYNLERLQEDHGYIIDETSGKFVNQRDTEPDASQTYSRLRLVRILYHGTIHPGWYSRIHEEKLKQDGIKDFVVPFSTDVAKRVNVHFTTT